MAGVMLAIKKNKLDLLPANNVFHNLELLVGIFYRNPELGLLGTIIFLIIMPFSFPPLWLFLAVKPVFRSELY